MQAQWNALLATALLGVEQRKCAVISPEVEFLSSLENIDPEKAHEAWVLLASAYATLYRRAGQIPPTVKPSQIAAPAPAETRPTCSAPVAARLTMLLNDKAMEPFLEELLALLASKGQLVPPSVLPDLLTWGKRIKARRALLIPVVGERGLWLTQQNPEWKNSLQVDSKESAESTEAQPVSGQQALYELLGITDNLFSKTFSVLKGAGFSAHGRLIQQIVDKIAASKPGDMYFQLQKLCNIAIATPPEILPELISRIKQVLVQEENSWRSKLVELMEFRHQMLEELAHE